MRKPSSHVFSVGLKSKEFLKNVMISDRTGETVLIEGFLGELEEASFVEDVMLELKGGNGVLRIDLKEDELNTLFKHLSHTNVHFNKPKKEIDKK